MHILTKVIKQFLHFVVAAVLLENIFENRRGYICYVTYMMVVVILKIDQMLLILFYSFMPIVYLYFYTPLVKFRLVGTNVLRVYVAVLLSESFLKTASLQAYST